MAIPKLRMFSSLMLAAFLLVCSASVAFAQDTTAPRWRAHRSPAARR